jgi:pimeloyl-ACP methyl ester carboxylesterase
MGRRPTTDHREPDCKLIRFEATDGVDLGGLLYEPRRRTDRAAVFLHGTGGASIFDSKRTNPLAEVFLRNRIAYFPFNNRGAHLVRWLRAKRGEARKLIGGGMAYELIRDCAHDIDGAVRMLRRRGYRDLTLIGHSTGANKIALYDRDRARNPVKRYVLLAGGDDVGLMYEQLGRRRFFSALRKAKEMTRARRGTEFVPASISRLPMSWRSLYDMINPDGDYNVFPFLEVMRGLKLSRRPLFRHVKAIRKPTLVLYGDRDEYCFGDVSRCVEIMADAVGSRTNFEFAIMSDADHGFSGREEELGTMLSEWLSSRA